MKLKIIVPTIVVGILIILIIIWAAPNPTDTSKVFNSTNPDPQSVQKINAIKLAESSIIAKSAIWIFNYHFDSVFYTSGFGPNGTFEVSHSVVYQSNNRSIGPLVVTEDPQSIRIIGIMIQPATYH
ncbi:MAG: hypothetical protein KGL95_07965 [Patescibacteria group bacterium]|nr:hypothetical protein [Patescibacteria group bacterium]